MFVFKCYCILSFLIPGIVILIFPRAVQRYLVKKFMYSKPSIFLDLEYIESKSYIGYLRWIGVALIFASLLFGYAIFFDNQKSL